MISEAIRHLTVARREVDGAMDDLMVGDRTNVAAAACARAVEELCAALTELAWAECDRATYGDGDEE